LCLLAGCDWWQASRGEPEFRRQVLAIVGDKRFDFVRWEATALVEEARDWAFVRPPDPASERAHDTVLRYLERAGTIESLRDEAEKEASVNNDGATRAQRLAAIEAQLTELRAQQERDKPLVERILEAQVRTVLEEEGLGWLRSGEPPPLFSFSEPPAYLVVSPRDSIATRTGVYLEPTLSLEEREAIEAAVESLDDNTSALIEDTGGFSTWPTMLVDWGGAQWILSTIAHEWVHVYLVLYPLGRSYYDSSDMTAINETVADIVGDEVGRLALERYYPELVPGGTRATRTGSARQSETFDFNREMRITRERVDALLAAGQVEQAEQYMEERRLVFVEHGYYIRRLNQAYFAFHGSYRTGAQAPSDDPIAPRLQRLRSDSASLAQFLESVREVSSLDDLLALVPEP